MKLILILAGMLACAGVASAQTVPGGLRGRGIVNSRHNFSGAAWSGREICKPCHTPHNAIPSLPRLWNHELTTATYTMHAGSGAADTDFDTISRMCLSCHDGTVALDNFGGNTAGNNYISNRSKLGTNLANDHPIGSDAEYPPEDPPVWWSTAFKDPPDYGLKLKDWQSKHTGNTIKVVSCATCHDVHSQYGNEHMLVRVNSASQLCLACHIK